MVSMNPSQGLVQGFYLDPSGTPLPGLAPLPPPPPPPSAGNHAEDAGKKVRKPYTISKSRESWTEQEHDKFLEAIQLFDRDWKKIEAFVGSKTVIQIRSHAQKYFLKVQKTGSNERVPPPRPKRKAAHPYPQKATKTARPASQSVVTYPATSNIYQPASVPSWNYSSVPAVGLMNENARMPVVLTGCCSSSSESALSEWPPGGSSDSRNLAKEMPDFAQVYSFLGSVFDPDASDHLQRLRMMDPIDVKTVLLLMKNLSINLTSPEFEDYRKLLSSYDVETGRIRPCSLAFAAPDSSKAAIPAM